MNTTLSREDADRLYRAIDHVEHPVEVMEAFTVRSRRYREAAVAELDVPYGHHIDERLDIFRPGDGNTSAPVHIFIHGGYWYQFGKSEWSFIAEALTAAGMTVVIPQYSLCPQVGLGEIVQQMRGMLCWVKDNIARYGGDPERISISGHSAGGHLAMELLFTDWVRNYGLPEDVIKSVLSISGLYDLRPLRASYAQTHLGLSESDAVRLSPLLHVRPSETPVALAIARNDPAGFHDQLDDMVKALGGRASEQVIHLPADHLSILDELARTDGLLLKHILTHAAQMRS